MINRADILLFMRNPLDANKTEKIINISYLVTLIIYAIAFSIIFILEFEFSKKEEIYFMLYYNVVASVILLAANLYIGLSVRSKMKEKRLNINYSLGFCTSVENRI
jgi:presenilin-like A22 family membrane protease